MSRHFLSLKCVHRDGRRFIVRADEKLAAFLELEAAIRRTTSWVVITTVGAPKAGTTAVWWMANSACAPYNLDDGDT